MAKGGYRPGSGRKPGIVAQAVARSQAATILERINDSEAWLWAYRTARKAAEEKGDIAAVKAVIEILEYLTDRRDGKAPQAVTLDSKTPVRIILGFTNGNNGHGN